MLLKSVQYEIQSFDILFSKISLNEPIAELLLNWLYFPNQPIVVRVYFWTRAFLEGR